MFVALSCGKDSAAMLSLVREIDPTVPARILLWPESEILGNYDATIAAWRAIGVHVDALRLTRASLDESVPERWAQLADVAPCDGHFVGLRASESRHRAIALGKYSPLHQYRSGPLVGQWRCAPLTRWSTDDVAAQIYISGAPLLDVYGDEGIDARSSTRIPRASARDAAMTQLQRRGRGALLALRRVYPE
ncbi:hypothetical protein [Hyphomicrobium sulfonivorans]|uniref:hypothetical protein n=1 Tax=Hyphomicrobium sulfonivorans TaxID=121290 RepID=UPI000AD3F60D|nr:hypothetical protein [Hyphomicrobium sulfonivorans]